MRRHYFVCLITYLILYEFFDSYSQSYYSVVVSYIQADFRIDSSTWYVVMGVASIGMILAWFIQFLADVVGRKPMLVIVFFGMGLASFVLYLSRTIGQFGIGFFLLWVFFSSDIWIIVLTEEAPEAKRARYASLVTVVGALGALAIPAARSLFIHVTPAEDPTLWRTMTYLAILAIPLSFLGVGLRETRAFTLRKEERLRRFDWRLSLRMAGRPFTAATRTTMRVFLVVGAVTGMLLGVFSTVEAYVSGITEDVEVVNGFVVAATLGTMSFFGIAGPLADRFGRKITFCAFVALDFVAVVFLVLGAPRLLEDGHALPVHAVAFVTNGAFWGALLVSKIHCLECFPTEMRGTSAGWRTFGFALGIVFGSLVAGALASVVALGSVYLVFSGMAVVVIPFLVLRYLPETSGIEINGARA